MTEQILTAEAVKKALAMYSGLPAATFFRGLTGLGFVVGQDDAESVGPVAKAKGVWKPMTFFVTGGERHGRRALTSADVKSAIEEFQVNPLWALLRVTSGKGLRLIDGAPNLVDVHDARSEIVFEVSHFGGRSIIPAFSTTLGKVTVPQIEWQGGFVYESRGNQPPMTGSELHLSRLLSQSEWRDGEEAFGRVWGDIEREAYRLLLLNTDESIPSVKEEPQGEVRAFLTQELTAILPNTRIVEERGYGYEVRKDGLVVVRRTIRERDLVDEAEFSAMLEAFRKECFRVYTLYCHPLGDAQRSKLGKPSDQSDQLVKQAKLTFERDARRSTPQSEQLIAWSESSKAPHFPYEGWMPEKGKPYRVFALKWGNGVRCVPHTPVYVERFVAKDEKTSSRQLVRVEYDGTEKIVASSDVPLEEKRELRVGTYWSPRAEVAGGVWTIVETNTDYDCLLRQQVVDAYDRDVSGKNITKIDWRTVEQTPVLHERRFPANLIWVEPHGGPYSSSEAWEKVDTKASPWGWKIKVAGINPDGKDVTVDVVPGPQKNEGWNWEDVPQALRDEFATVTWPVCQCGRLRYEATKFSNCRLCRDYRPCARCQKDTYFGAEKIEKAEAAGEKLYCDSCKQWLAQLELAKVITVDHKAKLVAEAMALLSGQVVEDDPKKFLTEVLERRVADTWRRNDYLRRIGDPELAVSNDAGYWSSKFTKVELERVAGLLNQTADEALVTIALILDQNVRYQIKHDPKAEPNIRLQASNYAWIPAQLGEGNPVLATLVIESEKTEVVVKDAIAQVEASYATIKDLRGKDIEEKDPIVVKVAEAKRKLEGAEFTEAKSLAEQARALSEALIEELRVRKSRIDAGEIWGDVRIPFDTESRVHSEGWAILPDGTILEPTSREMGGHRDRHVSGLVYGDQPTTVLVISRSHDNYGFSETERWKVHYLPKVVTPEQIAKVAELRETHKEYFVGKGTGWDLSRVGTVMYCTKYHRSDHLTDVERQVMDSEDWRFPLDVAKWDVRDQEREEGYPEPDPSIQTKIVWPYPAKTPKAFKGVKPAKPTDSIIVESVGDEADEGSMASALCKAGLIK